MKKIYLIYSFTGTYFSRFLKLMTNEKYIHISIALDGKLKKVYSFGRKNPKWMFPAGFIVEDLNLITQIFKNTTCQIYELEIKDSEYYRLKKVIKKYIKYEDKYKYNVKGLVHIKFNKIYRRDNHFVCSQFVGKILIDSGIYDFKKDYSLIKPIDIVSIPNLKLVYEGKIVEVLKEIEKNKPLSLLETIFKKNK